jgi:hypothetical protein
VEKGGKGLHAFAILIKLPKLNTHPLGENSPNLVTLVPIAAGTITDLQAQVGQSVVSTRHSVQGSPGTDVMILKIFSPKNFAKIFAFLLKLLLFFAKI